MPIYKSAYHTTIGRGLDVSKSRQAAEDTEIASSILTTHYADYMHGSMNGEDVQGALVTHDTASEAMIRGFIFPMVLDNPRAAANSGKKLVFADARPYMSQARNDMNRSRITNLMEFEMLRATTAATIAWNEKGAAAIMNLGPVLQQVYCRWLSRTIARRFSLDAMARIRLRVIAAYFFQCLFTDAKEFTESQKASIVASACRSSGVNYLDYENFFTDVDVIDGLNDFISVTKKLLPEAVQLDRLDAGIVMEQIQGTWFGFVGRPSAAAALEHPPTFAAMLYMSFAQNGYRKAPLSVESEAFKGAKGGAEYIRNVQLQLGLAA